MFVLSDPLNRIPLGRSSSLSFVCAIARYSVVEREYCVWRDARKSFTKGVTLRFNWTAWFIRSHPWLRTINWSGTSSAMRHDIPIEWRTRCSTFHQDQARTYVILKFAGGCPHSYSNATLLSLGELPKDVGHRYHSLYFVVLGDIHTMNFFVHHCLHDVA